MADAKKLLGGLGKVSERLLAGGEELTAAQRAEAGRKAAALIKTQPQVKASEALGQQMEKGMKRTTTTQADRTRVGGGNIGGAPFSAISEADPAYAGKVWGVMDEGTAARLKNLTDDETAWTTMLGSANQLKTNPIVFDKLKRQFIDSMKQGNLSPELEAKINHNLALNFGEGASIRDPKIWREANTFEKRAALADVMMGQGITPKKGGVALGGEKSGKGVIFRPTDTIKRETEPSLLHTEHGGDVPTFAAGPRLFKLEKESEYRPDLHPGFPTLLTGKDLEVNMIPTPTEVYLPDWHKRFKANNPDRKSPGYYDLALGVKGEGLPSQDLNDEYIRHLLREGFKKGGSVDIDAADRRLAKAMETRMAKGGSVDIEAADARLQAAIDARMGMAEGGEAGFKKLEFMADGGKLVKGLGKIGRRLMSDPAESSVTSARRGERMADERGGLNITKETGGNWLGGDVEKQIKKLQMGDTVPKAQVDELKGSIATAKRVTGNTEESQRKIRGMEAELDTQTRNNALNAWMDSNLSNYVKKQMGTADDPVRKLAEQDILHMKPYGTREAGSMVMRKRAGLGYPAQGLGQSETAKFWERLSDQAIDAYPAGSYKNGALDESILKNNPWLQNIPDETMIHSAKGLPRELGFDHVLDVLREDLRAGRIRPEQLNKVSMEQAVRRTAEYDQEMAKRMAETQLKATEGMPIHKDYSDKGYKWLELSQPKDLPKGWTQEASGAYISPTGERTIVNPSRQSLDDALKYEGDTMGHCVGNYCDDVASGKSRIYSLRDSKGEPHVTIETKNQKRNDPSKGLRNDSSVPQELMDNYQKAFTASGKHSMHFSEDFWPWLQQSNPEEFAKLTADLPPKIVQIKGKQNAAPKDEYLPFVQDFVKSGEWSGVGDLKNTGLIQREGKYLTPAEDSDWLLKELGIPPDGMAEGGAAFKKLQFMGGGGITTSGGYFSPEELGVSADEIGLSNKQWNTIKRNAPEVYEWAKQNVKDEASQLKTGKGVKDFALRTGAQYLGGIPDLINLGLMGVDAGFDTKLSSEKPWFGSEQYINAMHKAGMLGENEFPIAETVAGILAPAGLIKKGVKKLRNLPSVKEEPKKRQGGLSAMAR